MSIIVNNKDIKSMIHNNTTVIEWKHNGILVYGGKTVVTMNKGTVRNTGGAYCYSTIKEIGGPAFTQYDKNTVQCAINMNITVSMDGSINGRNRDRTYDCEVGLYNSVTKKYLTVAKRTIHGVWDTEEHFKGTKTFPVAVGDILKPYAYMSNPYGADLSLTLHSCTITYDPDNQ